MNHRDTKTQRDLSLYPRYESYKDSGEGWIGQIPTHWKVKKLKHLFYEKKHTPNMNLNSGAISFGKVVTKDDEKILEATKSSYQEVLSGEFLINPLNLNYDLISLRIALSEIDVVVSAGYIVIKEKARINKVFFKYLLHRYDVAYMKLLGSGVRQTISFNHIANSLLIYPSLKEQLEIANFLDQKTAQIDQAVAIKEKQIALLKERKQIIIQNAVTQGLNPNAPMKDSGIDWIGQIPEHWEVKKLKFVVDINKEVVDENSSPNMDVSYVDIGGASFENGIEKVEHYKFKNSPSRARRLANNGDTIVSTVRTYLKAIARIEREFSSCIFSTGFAVLSPLNQIDSKFLTLFAKSNAFTNQVMLYSKGMSYPAINATDLSNVYIILPAKTEQIEIVKFIEMQIQKIDQTIALQKQQIDKLKEYKTTLINSAVTGKIKITPDAMSRGPENGV